jgi:hypothetical protein
MARLILCSILLIVMSVAQTVFAEETEPAQRAAALVSALAETFQPPAWRNVTFSTPRRIEQTPGQIYRSGLAPVWVTAVTSPNGASGYLMWEDSPASPLIDFAWDAPDRDCLPKLGAGSLVLNVPNQQQFPVPGNSAPQVASGCVPTAGANLIGFWTAKGFQSWMGTSRNLESPPLLQRITQRLRERLHMQEIPDRDGFTETGMPLSGAFPEDLKDSLEKDAASHGIQLTIALERFSGDSLKRETAEGRPVLLSCMVRLPQKPSLSWGHEVVGTGWVEIKGLLFVGVRDNFLPSKSGETTRWIESRHIQTLVRAAPQPVPIPTE